MTTVYLTMCFHTALLKSTIGRIRGSLTTPRKSAEGTLKQDRLPNFGETVEQPDRISATESSNHIGSKDAEQRDSAPVNAERLKVQSAHDKREIEAMLRWAGWSKSQSITEASRDARAK